MPFLLLWPGVASLMLDSTSGPGREFGSLLAAYVIGTIGYAVAALMMTFTAIEQFDEKSGRTQGRSGSSPRPRPPIVGQEK